MSELEIEKIMQELDVFTRNDDGEYEQAVSCQQFLDKLKLFVAEYKSDECRCEELFKKFDTDGSGSLEREEVREMLGECDDQ